MSATAEVTASPNQKVRGSGASSLTNRIRARLHRHKLDKALAYGADPNTDPLRRERAQELVGEQRRHEIAACLERLLVEADSPPRGLFSSRVPIARAAIRGSRWDLETIVERLKAPAYLSPQGVAMLFLLVSDGAGPLYGNSYSVSYLGWRLASVLDAIDHGPVMVTV